MKKVYFLLTAFSFITIYSCKQPKDNHTQHEETTIEEEHPHWSYQGETGPEHWAEIEKQGHCDGQFQSPINIIHVNTIEDNEPRQLDIQYNAATKIHDVINNGHSIQYNFEPGDFLNYKGKKYDLKQIHFHEASEHTINGVRYPLEMHMVHLNTDNEYLVLAVMAEEGNNSEPFEFLESYLPIQSGEEKVVDQTFDLNLNLPVDRKYYHYMGSLTTPPCTEGVEWFVFQQPITISLDQVKVLQQLMPINNYRTEQPINGRIISRHP